jgi:MFS family permease
MATAARDWSTRNPLALLGRLPRTVRLLVAGTLVNRLGSFIVPFLTLVLRRDFHLSETETGLLVGGYGAGSIVSMLLGGVLTDRLGRRRTLLLSLFGSGLVAVAMGLVHSVRTFVPLLVAFSFIADLYRPASSAIIADLVPSGERAIGFAALRLAVNLGFGMGVTLGGVLADLSWRLLFWGDGATTLAFGTMAAILVVETRQDSLASDRPIAGPSVWRDGVFLTLITSTFIFCLAFFMDFFVFPLTVTESAGYPARTYGLLIGVNGFLIALFELNVVDWLSQFRRLRVATVGVTLTSIGIGITGLVMHWAWFLLCVLLWTAGEILTLPQQSAFLADWAPPERRGRYLGIAQASWGLGATIAPMTFLPLHSLLPEWAFWILLGLVVLPAAPLMLALDRRADRPERLRGRTIG